MRENLGRGACAGAQRAFHQARPGPGGVLPGEVDPAQGRGDELVVTGGRGDGRRGVRLARPRVVVPGGQHGPAEVQGQKRSGTLCTAEAAAGPASGTCSLALCASPARRQADRYRLRTGGENGRSRRTAMGTVTITASPAASPSSVSTRTPSRSCSTDRAAVR